ncbi:hypothetical protein IJ182_05565 [bacterium]|nr:hypothetical protein [bacterium]
MTNVYLANSTCAMFDKSKGSIKNRKECTKAHLKNELASSAKVLAGMTATSALGIGLVKQSQKGIAEVVVDTLKTELEYDNLNELKQSFSNATGLKKVSEGLKYGLKRGKLAICDGANKLYYSNAVQAGLKKTDSVFDYLTGSTLSKHPKLNATGTKTGFAIATLGTILVAGLSLAKYYHKKGQIDQKYTDKAQAEKSN